MTSLAADPKERHSHLMRVRGLRATNNRLLIMALLDVPNYKPTIPELYTRILEIVPDQGHTAVYNSVQELMLAGILRVILVRAKAHLDGLQQPHHNLICRSCDNVDSIPLEQINTEREEAVIKILGYHLGQRGLDLEVVCPRCLR